MQSSLRHFTPHHIAVIPDGNGRWAQARGRPRTAGHRAGARAVRALVEEVAQNDVECLTLYAFSSDNWNRPRPEVEALMDLFEHYLAAESLRCREQGVRLNILGRRDRLRPRLARAVDHAESVTRGGHRLLLRIALDYSARNVMARAAERLGEEKASIPRDGERRFEAALQAATHSVPGAPDVDLLIRTGGERRLSDFLLWECAYAELYFTPVLWPDFSNPDLEAALEEYSRRERRFGRIPELTYASGGQR